MKLRPDFQFAINYKKQAQEWEDTMPDSATEEISKGAFILLLDHLDLDDSAKANILINLEYAPFYGFNQLYARSSLFPHFAQPDFNPECL